MKSPPNPLDQFRPNFTDPMILWWPAFKIVEIYELYVELWLLRHQKGRKMHKLKKNSPLNPLVRFQDNVVEMWCVPDTSTFMMRKYFSACRIS